MGFTTGVERAAGVTEPARGGRGDARRARRSPAAKVARIAFGGSSFPCVLLNTSPDGAGLYLAVPASVPDLALLTLPDGDSRVILRRWQNGRYVGFEHIGSCLDPV